MEFFFTKFVSRVPILFDIKGCLVFMFALVYISKSLHAILSFALANGYDNVQVCCSAEFRGRSNSSSRPLSSLGIVSNREGGGLDSSRMESGGCSAGIQCAL